MIRWWNSLFAYDRWEVLRADRAYSFTAMRLRNTYSGRTRTVHKGGIWYIEDFPNRIWRR